MVHKHGNYVSGDEYFDDDALQKSAIQEDCEANDADVEQNEVNVQSRYETTVNQKVLRAMKQLEASFNPDASRMVEEAKGGNELLPMAESSAIALNAHMELVEPRTFQEAWNHPDPEQYRKWREAIRKELGDMNK